MSTAVPLSLGNRNLTVTIATSDALDVRDFHVEEAVSRPFEVRLLAVSENADIDFEGAVGAPARFEIHRTSAVTGETRYWSGVCACIEQSAVEEDGVSSYELRIVPTLWLATQRRNYRIFQDQSELDVALAILGEWGIHPKLDLSAGSYKQRRYRVQYAESDFDFLSRMLEDIGVSYHFEQSGGDSRLVLVDAPNRRAPRVALPFVSNPNDRIRHEYVTGVRTLRQVRPGRYTQSDVDFRKALDFPLSASATRGVGIETKLERYHHNYGSFLWKSEGGDTPVADDRGAARTSEAGGQTQVQRRLDAQRAEGRGATFATTAHDVAPGQVISILAHPRGEVGAPQLVVATKLSGSTTGEWRHHCETRYADVDYRPELSTPKPRTRGVESATVTGPAGEEIHTDEFGRVRAHFHWDRQGAHDQTSSCWIPVSQPWAGAGFGAISLPRVGQEVLVDFLGADPDRPIVIGRVFTTTTPPPYELPKYKMVGGMRSESYPKPKPKSAARMGGGPVAVIDEPTPRESNRVARPARAANDAAPASSYASLAPMERAEATENRAPMGGGRAAHGLGGVGDVPMSNGTVDLQRIMPGIFGGEQAPQDDLNNAVSRMRAPGPDGEDAKRSANGLVTDDTASGEKLYLQAQKDLRIAVKNNFVGSVGANRAFSVLRNDYEGVVGFQATKVGIDRTIEVDGLQKHTVTGDIIVDAKSNQKLETKLDFASVCLEGGHLFKSEKSIILAVGDKSFIIMTPTAILIDAPQVFINPGNVVMQAVSNGTAPAQAVADAQAEERVAAAAQQLADMVKNNPMLNGPIGRETLRVARPEAMHRARSFGAANDVEAAEAMRRAHTMLEGVPMNPFGT